MDAIRLSAVVGEDRRLVIDLPADTPVGPVEVEIRPHVAPEAEVVNPERERIRAKLLAAGFLAVNPDIPLDTDPLTDDELEKLGVLLAGPRPVEDLIDEDRGEY